MDEDLDKYNDMSAGESVFLVILLVLTALLGVSQLLYDFGVRIG